MQREKLKFTKITDNFYKHDWEDNFRIRLKCTVQIPFLWWVDLN